jgi:hypothetical protein
MTKKDYELIASTFVQQLSNYQDLTPEASAIRGVARGMATQLESTNPRFNRKLFLTACGVSGVN